MSTSKDASPLPVHYICSSAQVQSRRLLTLCATSATLYVAEGGQLRRESTLACDLKPAASTGAATTERKPPTETRIAFPRLAAFSPDGRHVAISGDDKSLRVWAVDALAYGSETLLKVLPKRAAALLWEDNENIIVADRFGDVRAFPLSAGVGTQSAQGQDAGAEPSASESCMRPRVGHVSSVCDVVLAPLPAHTTFAPALIITSDRDEHIRVSRWGPRRAGWVVENYLFGSQSFVGALVIARHAQRWLLLASDGGATLRAWDYLEHDVARQQLGSVNLGSALAAHLWRDALPRGALRGRKEDVPPDTQSMLAIVSLDLVGAEQSHVLFRAEACGALAVLPVSSVVAGTQDGLQVLELPRSVLHAHVEGGGTRILAALDTRHGSGDDVVELEWTGAKLQLAAAQPAELQAAARSDHAPASMLAALDLYTSLQLWQKTSSEGAQIHREPAPASRRTIGRQKNLELIFGTADVASA